VGVAGTAFHCIKSRGVHMPGSSRQVTQNVTLGLGNRFTLLGKLMPEFVITIVVSLRARRHHYSTGLGALGADIVPLKTGCCYRLSQVTH